jgi:hypothetical protein
MKDSNMFNKNIFTKQALPYDYVFNAYRLRDEEYTNLVKNFRFLT